MSRSRWTDEDTMAGLIGRKVGMTRVFDDEGTVVPVTVVEAGPCPVVQIQSRGGGGVRGLELGFGRKKEKRASKAELGHAVRSGLDYAPRVLREFRVTGDAE